MPRLVSVGTALFVGVCIVARPGAGQVPQTDDPGWSPIVYGLQMRLGLQRDPRISDDSRVLVPFLELRSVDDVAAVMMVDLDRLQLVLVDDRNRPIELVEIPGHSGHVIKPGTISLPPESSMRVGLADRGWFVYGGNRPRIAVASVFGAWTLEPSPEAFLVATLTVGRNLADQSAGRRPWSGTLTAPRVRVEWK